MGPVFNVYCPLCGVGRRWDISKGKMLLVYNKLTEKQLKLFFFWHKWWVFGRSTVNAICTQYLYHYCVIPPPPISPRFSVVKLSLSFAKKCTKKATHWMFLNTHIIQTRNPEKFKVTRAMTERFANSVIPYMQRLLNANS